MVRWHNFGSFGMYVKLQGGAVTSAAYCMYLLVSLWSLKRLWSNPNPFPCPLECQKCHSTPWSAKLGITAALEILEKSGAAELQYTEHSSGVNDWRGACGRTDTCLNPAYNIDFTVDIFDELLWRNVRQWELTTQYNVILKSDHKQIHIKTYNYTLFYCLFGGLWVPPLLRTLNVYHGTLWFC